MSVVIMGLSYKTAPLALRESLTISSKEMAASLERLLGSHEVGEAVILSTCNRSEIYARPTSHAGKTFDAIKAFFEQLYPQMPLASSLYRFDALNAVRHLFRVAAGLDSMVIGETEILGQVKNAYLLAQQKAATGKITNVLFQRALYVGKQVRTNTHISEGASSVGSVAVQLAERIFGPLNNHKVLLLGAGKMAEVTARHLLSQKVGEIAVLNRTLENAQELARHLRGRAGSLQSLESELLKADIVICSTSAEKAFITKDRVEFLSKARRGRSLYFIDISVPRNVEAGVHELDNVYVYNIDDLRGLVEENMAVRKTEVANAELMVDQLAAEFDEWLSATLEGKSAALRHHVDLAPPTVRSE